MTTQPRDGNLGSEHPNELMHVKESAFAKRKRGVSLRQKVVAALVMLMGVFCGTMAAFAEEISAEQSQVAVEAWMKKYGAITRKAVRRIETIADPVTGAQIHVAVLRGGGFVVTAADDRVLPVMAYSETGTFINDPDNPLLKLLQIDASAAKAVFGNEGVSSSSGGSTARMLAASAPATGRTDAQKEWDDLLGRTTTQTVPNARLLASANLMTASSQNAFTETRVTPLLKTVWGQTTHNNQKENSLGGDGLLCFNYYTPEWPIEPTQGTTASGDGVDNNNGEDKRYTTHYPCGCVATAGAQIMKRWGKPTRFSFDLMPDNPKKRSSEVERKAIGELTRDIGQKCNATYGPNTTMSSSLMVEKLKSSYSYKGAFWQSISGNDLSVSDGERVSVFDKQVIPNLIAGCPVSMSIDEKNVDDSGHSVVVDGLQYVNNIRAIHVNCGWNGRQSVNNTWYVPPTFSTSAGTFDRVKGIGINIHPTEKKAIIAGRVSAIVRLNGGLTRLNGGLKMASVVLKKNGRKVSDYSTDAHGQFYFLVDGGTYSLEITRSGYSATIVEDIVVSCTDSSVSNYYNDEIYLEAATSERVADVDVTPTSMDNGSWYQVVMSCATDGAVIHYTTDGSLPTEDSPLYSGEFSLRKTGTITLRAIAFKEGSPPSRETSGELTFTASNQNTQLRLAASITTAAGRTAMNNASATKESGEPVHSVMGKAGGASMWASFIAPEDGDYTFAASGYAEGDEDYSLDTQLAVYTGNSVNALTLVAANDDVNAAEYDLSSKVAFRATKGVAYKIAVDTRNGEKGTINLEWKEGREDVASPVEYDVYYTAEGNTYSIPIRSSTTWSVCDGSDWISVKKSSGADGESLSFELPEMIEEGTRSGVLLVCAGEDGPSSTIRITQGTTSWVTSRADALATAKTNGKRILMVCGRDTCSNTSYTRFTACEDATVKPLLLEGYVLWYCNCDEQWEDYYYYTDGLGGYTLPLVCIIDPVRPDAYVARSTGLLTASQLRQLLVNNAEGDLPTQPFEVCVDGSASDGTINVLWGTARRAQSYEVWRGTKWDPAEAILIASDVRTERYIDDTAEPSVLYYYRVRAVNGVGVGELSMPAVGCWRDAGAHGDVAIGGALGAPHLDWTTEGDYPWTVQGTNTYDGVEAMQSAFTDPKQSGMTSVLKTTVTGPTKMSFRYKTRMYSSRFTVKIDGSEAFLVTEGVSDWTLGVVDIPEGQHEIEFSYAKGGYYTSGFNGVYLDQVQFDVVSEPPSLSPATTDDEESASTFTGSTAVSIDAPAGSAIYYTLDGSEPSLASQRYEGTFTITASTRVKAMCVQDGYDCSATVSGLYLERHPVQAGEWTTDVEGAKKAALKNGSIIVTLLANYDTCYYSELFKEVSETAEFLSWARANGVYLITADSSRHVDTGVASSRFWDLFYDAGQSGSAYYPALAIANAWEPDKSIGYAVARSGQNIGNVAYDGTVAKLKAGLSAFFTARPSNSYVWVEFDGNGGTPYEKSRVGISGQAVGELPSAYRPYHYFEGWFTSADGGTEVSEGTVLDGDTVYYAHWRPHSYRVQYVPGVNGAGTQQSDTKTYNVALSLKGAIFTRTDYTQTGWATTDGGTKVYDLGASYTANATITLYPYWTLNQYKVTFGKNGGTGGDDYVTATYGKPMPTPRTSPTKAGYVFDGYWDTTKEGGVQYYDGAMKSVRNWDKKTATTLWAKWDKAVSVKVTFGKNGGSGGDNYVTATYGAAMPTPRTAPTLSGWTFAGYWDSVALDEKGNPKGKQYYDASMKSVSAWDKQSAMTLWAKWTNKVTFGKNGGTGGDNFVTVTKGQPMPKRTMPTKTGYVFDGYWNTTGAGGVKYYNSDGTSAHAWDRGGSVTLWAKWVKPVACKVTFGKNGGTGGDDYVTATTGKAMPTPRTAPKRTGWTFGGYWDTLACDASGNPLGKQYYDASMESVRAWDKTSAATLWAKWTVRVKLGKNGGTGGDDYATVIYNQPFPKRSMPKRTGYAFGGYFVSASSKTGQCYNPDGTGTASMKWSTGGTPTIWALWTKTSSCFELPPAVARRAAAVAVSAPSASAAPAPAEPAIPAGIYSGVLADGSGAFWLVLDEAEKDAPRTAFLYVASEDGSLTAECTAEEADGILLLMTDGGGMYVVDIAARIAICP